MFFSRVGGRLLLVSLFVLCRPVLGQLGPYPSWAASIPASLTLGAYNAHPALGSVGVRFKAHVMKMTTSVRVHGYMLQFHPDHGGVAVLKSIPGQGFVRYGSLSLGFQYVFGVDVCRDDSDSPIGVVVFGSQANGKSKVMFGSWTNQAQTIESVSFSSLVGESAAGERWVSASIVTQQLFILEGVSGAISRYIDTNNDSVPDSLDVTVAPLSLVTASPSRYGVFGFSRTNRSGEVRIKYGMPHHSKYWTIAEVSNALVLITRSNEIVPEQPVGNLVGPMPVIGTKVLRVHSWMADKIQVFAGLTSSEPISALTEVPQKQDVYQIELWRAITANDQIVVRASSSIGTVNAAPVAPGPARLQVLSGGPRYWYIGEKLLLRGSNFGEMTTATLTVDGTPTSMELFLVNDSTIVMASSISSSSQVRKGILTIWDTEAPSHKVRKFVKILVKQPTLFP